MKVINSNGNNENVIMAANGEIENNENNNNNGNNNENK
jgi:hypothetical protein